MLIAYGFLFSQTNEPSKTRFYLASGTTLKSMREILRLERTTDT